MNCKSTLATHLTLLAMLSPGVILAQQPTAPTSPTTPPASQTTPASPASPGETQPATPPAETPPAAAPETTPQSTTGASGNATNPDGSMTPSTKTKKHHKRSTTDSQTPAPSDQTAPPQ
jgi:hypothetical protein